ncbi:MAG TPA: response regulator [Cyanobacteria bacterium UBA12227]|nr:response regulator [Cyanobacteria bacterium UBA12227]HAX89952.1 response regulator [Cyanobacteria bacterium UBA11370]HBY76821.1 response regulator [Cyanobacteria bacterium UBA11148]
MALILITDDAAFSRRMIRKAVQEGGYEVIEAANGLECLEMVATNSPDCIISDLLMPELDGFGVLKALRDQGSNIPVVVLSADIQDSARQQCLELGAFMMLKKPPKAPEILEALQKALSGRQEMRA